jgi:hypothetical protein
MFVHYEQKAVTLTSNSYGHTNGRRGRQADHGRRRRGRAPGARTDLPPARARHHAHAYLALTAEDFWEVGASGRVYDRGPTLRVTLWRRDEDGCKIVYHQRTLIQDA